MLYRRAILLASTATLLIAGPVAADPWYEHYANAERALLQEDWPLAVEQINAALERKGDSGARVRSYGMNVTAYFPYLRLGIAYYHLGQFDAAVQAFETEDRLGAIAEDATASAELQKFRTLAMDAKTALAAEERERIRTIVEGNLQQVATLVDQGLIAEAMAAADRALAVAPDNDEALAVMAGLRRQIAELERMRELDRRVTALVEEGRGLLGERRYAEASSVFRQALFLRQDAAVQSLLDSAQSGLTGTAGPAGTAAAGQVTAMLSEVQSLESQGLVAEALERLQSVLALDPDNEAALDDQRRLLALRSERQEAAATAQAVERLLEAARSEFEAGSVEKSLAAANQVLALEPGNQAALEHVARAYAVISRRLLGARRGGNIPPAIRFVDLREEGDDGILVQTTRSAAFRLNGVVIDDSPVAIVFYVNEAAVEPSLESVPLGDFYLTEFSVDSALPPGRSVFRLVATDSQDLSSGSEYVVLYVRPLLLEPWFKALLLAVMVIAIAIPMLLGYRRRAELRRRRFNPYVAGAPVLNDDMFFGRRELVDRILQTIHNNSLLIYGERRIGKTSIQHQLKRRLLNLDDPRYQFHPVYVDLQGTPQEQFFWTIAEDVVEELAPDLKGLAITGSAPDEYDYRDFVSDLRTLIKYLQGRTAKTIKLVLLIDEVDELNEYDPRINQKLRSLFMRNFAENLVAVVSGVEIKKRWEREGSPWYNFFEEIEVRPFEPEDARELIRKPIDKIFKLDTDAVDRIISLTGCRPYLIQKLCVALVTRLHEQGRRRITVADVDAVAGGGGAPHACAIQTS